MQDGNKKEKIEIESREKADRALKRIAELEGEIGDWESIYGDQIRGLNDDLVVRAKPLLAERKAAVDALEKWARANAGEWAGRSLALNFGRLSFRVGTGAISLKRSVEYVMDHLRAKKLFHCIRTVHEPNKEALKALDDATLKEIGCRREKPDYFHYEVFKTEVK